MVMGSLNRADHLPTRVGHCINSAIVRNTTEQRHHRHPVRLEDLMLKSLPLIPFESLPKMISTSDFGKSIHKLSWKQMPPKIRHLWMDVKWRLGEQAKPLPVTDRPRGPAKRFGNVADSEEFDVLSGDGEGNGCTQVTDSFDHAVIMASLGGEDISSRRHGYGN